MAIEMDHLGTLVLATGALGTAAFGVVEGLKWTRVGTLGFDKLTGLLGESLWACLKRAYGPNHEVYIKALYRQDRTAGDLPRALRQGARIGLSADLAAELTKEFGEVVTGDCLKEIVEAMADGEELSDEQRGRLGRFELAVDARIDAAMAQANAAYVGYVRMLASGIAVALALFAASILAGESGPSFAGWKECFLCSLNYYFRALLVGLAAVPLAPIAKDLVNALKAAGDAIRRKVR